MKLNISLPATHCQKFIKVVNEYKSCTVYEKGIPTEVAADVLGEECKGYMVQISGGNDKWQIRLPHEAGCLGPWPCLPAVEKGSSCYRSRRIGERKHKST